MSTPRFTPRRALGRTGFVATRIGIGDVADRKLGLERCADAVRAGLDVGLNLVDTAPSYENGFSEEILAHVLRGRPRDEVFVVDKVDELERPVRAQVEASLSRLQLAHVDLMVFHGVKSLAQWEALARGPFAELERARDAKLVRWVGISCHHPDALRAAILSDRCDAVLFPIGPFVHDRYREELLPLARERNVGTIAFKTFAAGKLLDDPARCVRYTLTVDPDVALLGMSTPDEVATAARAGAAFTPMSEDELRATRAWAAERLRGKGPFWWNPDPHAGN
jgi:aryl-alcohol dehydrogenase-like predicted oxidoreductase